MSPIAEAGQTLHVGVVHFLLIASATHSRASRSVMDDDSSPWRMRVFLSKSTARQAWISLMPKLA